MQVALNRSTREVSHGLEAVFLEHQARVFRAAYRITGNTQDAEDVLQSVFLRLTFQGEPPVAVDNLGGYLHRTAANAALDLLRTRRGRTSVPVEEAETLERSAPDPERVHAAAEIRDALRSALARLPPQAALVFALRYLEGYGNHEIAKMLDLSRVTVAVSLHRTRRRLQTELESLGSGR